MQRTHAARIRLEIRMPPQATLLNIARNVFTRGMAPLGASRANGFLQGGLASEFRPALDFVFSEKLTAADKQVVTRVEAMRSAFLQSGTQSHTYGVEQFSNLRSAQHLVGISSVTPRWGTFLYLAAKGFHADTILELGSCIGISGSYLASAPACRQFVSIERSAEVAHRADACATDFADCANHQCFRRRGFGLGTRSFYERTPAVLCGRISSLRADAALF